VKLFHFCYSLVASLCLAVSYAFVAVGQEVAAVVSDLFGLAFPPPTRSRLDLAGALQAEPVLGRVETRAFSSRLLSRLTRQRSRAPDSMAFVSA
jgi:hypothetical protein